jgi:hypothetical protein
MTVSIAKMWGCQDARRLLWEERRNLWKFCPVGLLLADSIGTFVRHPIQASVDIIKKQKVDFYVTTVTYLLKDMVTYHDDFAAYLDAPGL